jgi:HTH-type transcriptional regulator, competence development regulator
MIDDRHQMHRLTLRELGERVGMDFTYLSKIENDKGDPPSEEAIRRLAAVLRADADELILLADKLPTGFERDLLARPESQVAGLYRSMAGKRYSDEEWQEVLRLLKKRGEPA